MADIYFVTGTDTGIGKSVASVALLRAFQSRGQTALGMKPVASGCELTPEGLRNADALALRSASSFELPYDQINPYAFAPPVAPHLAAEQVGVMIDLQRIRAQCLQLATQADVVVVEGVGGWLVPLNESESVEDLARVVDAGVILVVGIRLGCLNHALLTAQAIVHSGVRFCGWIANIVEPHGVYVRENIDTLKQRLSVPCMGVIPNLDPYPLERGEGYLDLTVLG